MSGIDYSKSLAKTREGYYDALDDLRESNERAVENLEKSHEEARTNQKENYLKDRIENEKAHGSHVAKLSKSNQEALERRKESYLESLKGKESNFQIEREKNLKKFNESFSDVRDAYEKSRSENERFHNQIASQKDGRYQDKIERQQSQHEKEIGNINKYAQESVSKMGESNRDEKRDILIDNRKMVDALRREEADEKIDLKRTFSHQVENLRDEHVRREELEKHRVNNHLNHKESTHELEMDDFLQSVNESSSRMAREATSQKRDVAHRFNKKIRQMERAQAEDTAMLRRKLDDVTNNDPNSEGSRANFEKRQLEQSFDNKIENQKNAFLDYRRKTQEEQDLANSRHQDALKTKSKSFSKTMELKEKDLNNFYMQQNEKFDEEKNHLSEAFKAEVNNQKRFYDDTFRKERTAAKIKFDNNQKAHDNTVGDMSAKQYETIDRLQQDFAKDKKLFIDEARRDRIETVNDMRYDYVTKIALKDQGHQKQVDTLHHEKMRMAETYEKKLRSLDAKMKDELERVTIHNKAKAEQDKRDHKEAMMAQELEFRQRLQAQQIRSDKKIAKMKINEERAIEKLTDSTKKEVDDLKNYYQTEMNKLRSESETRYQRLRKSSELQRNSLIAQFETKMEKMKLGQEQTIDHIVKQYKERES